MFDSDYTGFVPSNPIWVEEPTFYNYQHFYYTTPFTTSTTTTQKPKKLRKKLKVKLKKKPTKKVIENDFYLIDDDETEKNEEGLVSKIVNFLAFITGISSTSETDDSTILAKQAQCLKIPQNCLICFIKKYDNWASILVNDR